MAITYHVSQSVDGAIQNWTRDRWENIAKDNNLSVAEVKLQFLAYKAEGKKVIPIGEECEGFNYVTGCPGHTKQEEKEKKVEMPDYWPVH